MTAPTDAELTDAWTTATRNAVTALFAEYPDHHFYYLSLAVSDESMPPFLVAMSEAMLAQVRNSGCGEPGSASWVEARWNYACSPVENVPWDDSDVPRAHRMNPPGPLRQEWLDHNEVADPV